MKTLKFIVDNQIIKPDLTCTDFDDLVPGTEGVITAKFTFSNEWRGFAKVAAFYSMLGREYRPQALRNDNTCSIPIEALSKRAFKIQIIGKKGDSKLITNKIVVKQNGGRK